MSEKDIKNLTLESYENEFSFKENKSNLNISFNRIAFIFFIFSMVCLIYSIKIFYLGSLNSTISQKKIYPSKINFRADIVDKNKNFIAKTVNTLTVGIRPNLIINEKKLLINLQLIFPDKDFSNIRKRIKKKKYFRIQRELSQDQIERLRNLGDKSIEFEEQITRIYPQKNLFSHIIGQIDDDNKGISGIEKFFDYELKKRNEPLKLTVDTDIQFLIREELIKAQEIFQNIGSASILMDVNNGNILSMVSLPDFDLNKREDIQDVNYINRATKGVYEFGSVFKTFTFTAGLNEGEIEPETSFINLKKKIYCAGRSIGEYDDKIPTDLTAEEILIRSGNIGSVRIGQKVGIERFKFFLENIGILNKIEFDIEEVGQPISFRWGKCKLATSSFGHGITTTLLQLAKGYSIVANGGYDIKPTLIKKPINNKIKKKRFLREGVSEKVNKILRKIVSTKEGTAEFANVNGYEVGGKTGTAQKSINGVYSKNKVNTFVAIFPTSKPKYVLIVLLDEPKPNKEHIYYYRDGRSPYKGNWRNTAGWTSVEIAGKIIEKIGPILATKYVEPN
ncbi:MAG TPA: penicillin-binding protein 2 [Candidatus Pelagibacter bacterium]|jgi:cell division protein FtsI (penicillin-binding protein 3)|nr:penicillin-binding protein 2 [Candidatus Pelagibacter bacterium]|tara:strand:- start:22324 stop:24012 length:1689 start_codon:yes stop_codon:yes gene_type:complete